MSVVSLQKLSLKYLQAKEKKFKPMRMPQKRKDKSEDDSFNDRKQQQQQQIQQETEQNLRGKKGAKVFFLIIYSNNKLTRIKSHNNKKIKLIFMEKWINNRLQWNFQVYFNQKNETEFKANGYIQSYIDFFYITHDNIPSISKYNDQSEQFLDQSQDKQVRFNQGAGGYQMQNNDDEQELLELKKELAIAERASRFQKIIDNIIIRNKEKLNQAQESYFQLAEQFFHKKKFNDSGYFFKRNKLHEIKAKLGLGRCLESLENINEAIAEENEYQTIVEDTAKELVSIYSQFAEQYQRDDVNQALVYYEKCLEVAQKSGEKHKAATGNISFKIGLLYFNSKDFKKSIEYQKRYLEILNSVKPQDLIQKQMQACKYLAKSFLNIDKLEDAKNYLEQYHETARQSTDFNQESKAALLLAKYHQKKGNIVESLKYFQEHFEKAKSEKKVQGQKIQKKRKLIDKARVAFGIAKANYHITDFIEKVKNSDKKIEDLLAWKEKEGKNS